MLSLADATPGTISHLLRNTCDWNCLIEQVITLARVREKSAGMEEHHIEPSREEVVWLHPLEHLAIHICEAKLNPSDSTHAKVGAFVKSFPGSYRRIVRLPKETRSLVLSFGQTRPSRTVEEMTRIANLPQAKVAQKENGSRTGKVTGPKTIVHAQKARRGQPCTWGDKISLAINAKGMHTCPHCGKVMKNIASNILQHERGLKCK
jgi:hypothetical protein